MCSGNQLRISTEALVYGLTIASICKKSVRVKTTRLQNIMSQKNRIGKSYSLALLAALTLLPFYAHAAAVKQITTAGQLQQAINDATEGDVLELAAGTYAAPSGSFTIYNSKGFTLRAAAGANVVLDGGGTTDLVRLANVTAGTGHPVTFERLTFSNASNTANNTFGGAMTLDKTEAVFRNCTFNNNQSNPATTGGGAHWINASVVYFQSCTWTNNSSKNYGGAVSMLNSRVYFRDCNFSGNRSDVPGHKANATGGAIHVDSCTLRIANTRFENNRAGFIGGAIYTIGHWNDTSSAPVVDLVVSDSLFTGNHAEPDPSVPISSTAPPLGGAVAVEDQTTAKFYNTRFFSNSGRQGGAISNYRAITEFEGCVFKGNQAIGTGNSQGIGGTLLILSSDNNDSTTNNGTVNRRTAQLTMTDCLVLGSGAASPGGREGGGIFAAGDFSPLAMASAPDPNRAHVTLTRVAFVDLAVAGSSGTPGTGGAIKGDFANITVDSCIFQKCAATSHGGALQFGRGCDVTVTNSTIAGNSAGELGGGIAMFGGALQVSASNFVDNSAAAKGGAITTSPDSGPTYGGDMTGVILNCVLSNNTGPFTIYDGDIGGSVNNRLQYSTNRIFPGDNTAFFGDFYGPLTVAQLNAVTAKVPVANTAPGSAPTVGGVLMTPRTVLQVGSPGESLPIPSSLTWASSGGAASLDGVGVANNGISNSAVDGTHTLTVASNVFPTIPAPPSAAVNISTRLPVGTGEDVLIGGFIIQGPTPKRVIIRAIGPSSPVAGALQDPTLQLVEAATGRTIATNNNWRITELGAAIPVNQVVDVQATSIPPTNDAESAIVATLDPGAYTAIIRGANNATGIALIEVYDLDPVYTTKLANISSRGFINSGDNVMIGGFILLGGTGPTKVVVRGIGPSSGVPGALADPTLEVRDGNGGIIASNDDWTEKQAEIQGTGLQPGNNKESAVLLTGLARGNYTAIVKGKNGGTGVGLVEFYVYQ